MSSSSISVVLTILGRFLPMWLAAGTRLSFPFATLAHRDSPHFPNTIVASQVEPELKFNVFVFISRLYTDPCLACTTCSGQPARRRCSRCKAAYYCDRNCQKSDWKTHRTLCEPVAQGYAYSAPATPNFSNPASPVNES